MAEELDGVADSESSSGNQVPSTTSEVPRISAEELKQRLDNGEAILIVDTRSTAAYASEHIAGAISVPSLNTKSPLDEVPLDHEIVLYCA